jgi:hypothetical protein
MIVTTLVTGQEAFRDVQTLLFTLGQYHKDVEVYVYTDSPGVDQLKTLKTSFPLHVFATLDKYTGLTRKDMEAMSGTTYSTMFHDFTMEKATLMAHALRDHPEGVWFLDADICLFSALPVIPEPVTLALSPHMIRPGDESRFGRYNAGMIWLRDPALLDVWRGATHGSRFFEQASLEEVAKVVNPEQFYELPIQQNFGWWRLIQSADPPPVIQKRMGYKRVPSCVGLTYEGEVLASIHTHWHETSLFNQWIRGALEVVGRSHSPAKQFLAHLKKLYSNSSTHARI